MSTYEVTFPTGERRKAETILEPWKKRRETAIRARRPFEGQWMTNQAFAAGNHLVEFHSRDHRVIDMRPTLRSRGRSDARVDALTQGLWTAIGKFAKDDFRPQLLFQHSDEEGEEYGSGANKAFGWGWDEEWRGDEVLLDLLLTLVTFGTGAIRARFDKTRGAMLEDVPHAPEEGYKFADEEEGKEFAYKAGEPILHLPAARDYVSSAKYYGEPIDFKNMHEGQIVWELLTPWNLLPPPAIEDPRNFPWHLIVRPVHLDQLKATYGDRAEGVKADEVEAMNMLGLKDVGIGNDERNPSMGGAKLEEHALVYTGFEMPCPDYPKGAVCVFTHDDTLLDVQPVLPLQEQPHGPRSGLSYFQYWPVKQRFWGRALIEPGIGPQRVLNKREQQMDDIIDRALPKVYAEEGTLTPPEGYAMEQVDLKPGAPRPTIDQGIGPASWFNESRQQQLDNIERGLGIHAPSVGENAPPGTPYALMALQAENDADKLDPISKAFKLGVSEVSRDSLELTRQWPEGKLMLIPGDDDRLDMVTYAKSMIPTPFMVKPAKGATIPRFQGAELQKIKDLWDAAVQAMVVQRDPIAWLDWLKTSTDNGKAEELPTMDAMLQQRHKAALENVVMVRTGQPLPVAPYDDAQTHVEEHTEEIIRLSAAAMEGDPEAEALIAVIDQHRQEHVIQAQQNAVQNAAAIGPPAPGPQAPPAPPMAA